MFADTRTVAHRPTTGSTGCDAPAPVRTARVLTGACIGVHIFGGGVAFGGTALVGAASGGMSHTDQTLGQATGWSSGSLAVATVVLGLLFFGQAFVDGWVFRMLGTVSRRRLGRIVATAQPAVTRILTTIAVMATTGDDTALVPGLTTAAVGALVWSVLLWGPRSSRRWFAPSTSAPAAGPMPVARPLVRRPVVTHRPVTHHPVTHRPVTPLPVVRGIGHPTAVLAARIPAPRRPVGTRGPVRR